MLRVDKQAFACFQWYSHKKNEENHKLTKAVARLRFGTLGRAFNAMRTHASNKSYKRRKVAEVILCWRTNKTKASFANWRHVANFKRDLNEKVCPRGLNYTMDGMMVLDISLHLWLPQ